jgi:DNA-binding transcriptional LysR family regulator
VLLTVNQFFTAGKVVAASDLLTVLPRHFLKSTGIEDQLVALPLPFDIAPVHVDMVWHKRHQRNAAHTWLHQAVLKANEEHISSEN